MSISTTVRQCLAKFKAVEDKCHNRTDIEDEHGRFRVWAGNIAAHRSGGRRSLEYRLRDSSNLQSMVSALLLDLQKALDDLANAINNGILSTPAVALPAEHAGSDAYDDDSDDEDDAALFGVTEQDGLNDDPLTHIIEEIREINMCLLRFSMTLRNPARHDQMKESASTSTRHFERFDIDHVRDKFPKAEQHLHERLGKGISKHRQYFKYREDHHSKLKEGLDDEEVKHERPSTIATSLNVPVPEIVASQGDGLETESLYTATSFAPTTAGDSPLRPPPLPEAGKDGSPFVCPLCFGIVVAEDERTWRQHLYEDLPPYICTHTNCITANQRYSRRRDWQRHQAIVHNRHWLCPYGCTARFNSESGFQSHLVKKHGASDANVQTLLDTCAVASNEVSDLACPLCLKQFSSSKVWTKHLGHHLEQLALHAIPKHVFTLDSDDESVATGQSARSSQSSGVQHNVDLDIVSEPDESAKEVALHTEDDSATQQNQDSRPFYPKIHRDYLSTEILEHHQIPFRKQGNYLILLQELTGDETQALIEQTRQLRLQAAEEFDGSGRSKDPKAGEHDAVNDVYTTEHIPGQTSTDVRHPQDFRDSVLERVRAIRWQNSTEDDNDNDDDSSHVGDLHIEGEPGETKATHNSAEGPIEPTNIDWGEWDKYFPEESEEQKAERRMLFEQNKVDNAVGQETNAKTSYACPVEGCHQLASGVQIDRLKQHLEVAHSSGPGVVASEFRIRREIVDKQALIRLGFTIYEDGEFWYLASGVRRLALEQHNELERHFQAEQKPSTNTKKLLSESMNVPLGSVNNWFQNRRAKAKQEWKKNERIDLQDHLERQGYTQDQIQAIMMRGQPDKWYAELGRPRDVDSDAPSLEEIEEINNVLAELKGTPKENMKEAPNDYDSAGDKRSKEQAAEYENMLEAYRNLPAVVDQPWFPQEESNEYTAGKPTALNSAPIGEAGNIIYNSISDHRENRIRIVDPPTEEEAQKSDGILKKPTERFPEDPNVMREGVTRLKDATESDFPPHAKWTKIDRKLVNPEALVEAGERFEERFDSIIVLRPLSKEEIQKLADRTKEIRDERDSTEPSSKRSLPARECANCHTRVTPEWQIGPSGQQDLCNSCGLRWAKLSGYESPQRSSSPERSVQRMTASEKTGGIPPFEGGPSRSNTLDFFEREIPPDGGLQAESSQLEAEREAQRLELDALEHRDLNESHDPLRTRRTLDQSFYHNIDTQAQDSGQAGELARRWFIPREGIDRHIIEADIQKYLDNKATVRPGDNQGVPGYWIKAYRNLTPAMISNLRADTQEFRDAIRRSSTRGLAVESEVFSAPSTTRNENRRERPETAPTEDISSPSASMQGPSTQSPAVERLQTLQRTLATKKEECQWFLQNASSLSRSQAEHDHRRFSEGILTQVLLQLDAIETEGDAQTRAERIRLVKEAQALLNQLDTALSRPETNREHPDTAEHVRQQPEPKEWSPPLAESEIPGKETTPRDEQPIDSESISIPTAELDEREEEEKRIRDKIRLEAKEAKEKEKKLYTEFLEEQKSKAEKEKVQKEKEEEEFQKEMGKRLKRFGYTDAQIDVMVKQELEKSATATTTTTTGNNTNPVYPKIHKKYLSVETLRYYELPWEYDAKDSDYIIVKREMDKYEPEVLFEHTRKHRAGGGRLLVEPPNEEKKNKEFSFFRKRDRSTDRNTNRMGTDDAVF